MTIFNCKNDDRIKHKYKLYYVHAQRQKVNGVAKIHVNRKRLTIITGITFCKKKKKRNLRNFYSRTLHSSAVNRKKKSEKIGKIILDSCTIIVR